MRSPVLGMTTYLQQAQTGVWDVHAGFLPAIYFQGVNLAGGIAVLLPPQPVDSGAAVIAHRPGTVTYVTALEIRVTTAEGEVDRYVLMLMVQS